MGNDVESKRVMSEKEEDNWPVQCVTEAATTAVAGGECPIDILWLASNR